MVTSIVTVGAALSTNGLAAASPDAEVGGADDVASADELSRERDQTAVVADELADRQRSAEGAWTIGTTAQAGAVLVGLDTEFWLSGPHEVSGASVASVEWDFGSPGRDGSSVVSVDRLGSAEDPAVIRRFDTVEDIAVTATVRFDIPARSLVPDPVSAVCGVAADEANGDAWSVWSAPLDCPAPSLPVCAVGDQMIPPTDEQIVAANDSQDSALTVSMVLCQGPPVDVPASSVSSAAARTFSVQAVTSVSTRDDVLGQSDADLPQRRVGAAPTGAFIDFAATPDTAGASSATNTSSSGTASSETRSIPAAADSATQAPGAERIEFGSGVPSTLALTSLGSADAWRREDEDTIATVSFVPDGDGSPVDALGIAAILGDLSAAELILLLVQQGALSDTEALDMLSNPSLLVDLEALLASGEGVVSYVSGGSRDLAVLRRQSIDWARATLATISGPSQAITREQLIAAWLISPDVWGVLELLWWLGSSGDAKLRYEPGYVDTFVGPAAKDWERLGDDNADDFFEYEGEEGWLYESFVDWREYSMFANYGIPGRAGPRPLGPPEYRNGKPVKFSAGALWADMVPGRDGRYWVRTNATTRESVFDFDTGTPFRWDGDDVDPTWKALADLLYAEPDPGQNGNVRLPDFHHVRPEELIELGIWDASARDIDGYRNDIDWARSNDRVRVAIPLLTEDGSLGSFRRIAIQDHISRPGAPTEAPPRQPMNFWRRTNDDFKRDIVWEEWGDIRDHGPNHALEYLLRLFGQERLLDGATTVVGGGDVDLDGTIVGDDTVVLLPGAGGDFDFGVGDTRVLSIGPKDGIDISNEGGSLSYTTIGARDTNVGIKTQNNSSSQINVDPNSVVRGTLDLGGGDDAIRNGGLVDLSGSTGGGDDLLVGPGSGRVDLDFGAGDDTILVGTPLVRPDGQPVTDPFGLPVFATTGGVYDLSGTQLGEGDDTVALAAGSNVTMSPLDLGYGNNSFVVLDNATARGTVVGGNGPEDFFLLGNFEDLDISTGESFSGQDRAFVGATARGDIGIFDESGAYFEVWRNRLNNFDSVFLLGAGWQPETTDDGVIQVVQRDDNGDVITRVDVVGDVERVQINRDGDPAGMAEILRNIAPEQRTRANILSSLAGVLGIAGLGIITFASGGAFAPFAKLLLAGSGVLSGAHLAVNNVGPEVFVPVTLASIGGAVGGPTGKAVQFGAGSILGLSTRDPITFVKSTAGFAGLNVDGSINPIAGLVADQLDNAVKIAGAKNGGEFIEGVVRAGVAVGSELGGVIEGGEQTRIINLFAEGIDLYDEFTGGSRDRSVLDLAQLLLGAGYSLSRSLDGTRPSGTRPDDDPLDARQNTTLQLPAGYDFESGRTAALGLAVDAAALLDTVFDHDDGGGLADKLADTLDIFADTAERLNFGERATGTTYVAGGEVIDGVLNTLPVGVRAVSESIRLLDQYFDFSDLQGNAPALQRFLDAKDGIVATVASTSQANLVVGRNEDGDFRFIRVSQLPGITGEPVTVREVFDGQGERISRDDNVERVELAANVDVPTPSSGTRLGWSNGTLVEVTERGQVVASFALDGDSYRKIDGRPQNLGVVTVLSRDGVPLAQVVPPGVVPTAAELGSPTAPPRVLFGPQPQVNVDNLPGPGARVSLPGRSGDVTGVVVGNSDWRPLLGGPARIETERGDAIVGGLEVNSVVVRLDTSSGVPADDVFLLDGRPTFLTYVPTGQVGEYVVTQTPVNTINGLGAADSIGVYRDKIETLTGQVVGASELADEVSNQSVARLVVTGLSNQQVPDANSLEWLSGSATPALAVDPDLLGEDSDFALPLSFLTQDAFLGATGFGLQGTFRENFFLVNKNDAPHVVTDFTRSDVRGFGPDDATDVTLLVGGINTNLVSPTDATTLGERSNASVVVVADSALGGPLGPPDAFAQAARGRDAQQIPDRDGTGELTPVGSLQRQVESAVRSGRQLNVVGFSNGTGETAEALLQTQRNLEAEGLTRDQIQEMFDSSLSVELLANVATRFPVDMVWPENNIAVVTDGDFVRVLVDPPSPGLNKVYLTGYEAPEGGVLVPGATDGEPSYPERFDETGHSIAAYVRNRPDLSTAEIVDRYGLNGTAIYIDADDYRNGERPARRYDPVDSSGAAPFSAEPSGAEATTKSLDDAGAPSASRRADQPARSLQELLEGIDRGRASGARTAAGTTLAGLRSSDTLAIDLDRSSATQDTAFRPVLVVMHEMPDGSMARVYMVPHPGQDLVGDVSYSAISSTPGAVQDTLGGRTSIRIDELAGNLDVSGVDGAVDASGVVNVAVLDALPLADLDVGPDGYTEEAGHLWGGLQDNVNSPIPTNDDIAPIVPARTMESIEQDWAHWQFAVEQDLIPAWAQWAFGAPPNPADVFPEQIEYERLRREAGDPVREDFGVGETREFWEQLVDEWPTPSLQR